MLAFVLEVYNTKSYFYLSGLSIYAAFVGIQHRVVQAKTKETYNTK